MSSRPEYFDMNKRDLRQFYLEAVLFVALSRSYQDELVSHHQEPPPKPQSDEEHFHRFLDKLALVCDYKLKGSTTTAFVVMHDDARVDYIFGCNDEGYWKQKETAKYVKRLLESVVPTDVHTSTAQHDAKKSPSEIIIDFNHDCLKRRFENLFAACVQCISLIDLSSESRNPVEADTSSRLKKGLKLLKETLEKCKNSTVEGDECENSLGSKLHRQRELLILADIEPCISSFDGVCHFAHHFYRDISLHLNDDGTFADGNNLRSWRELRHSVSRIIAYKEAPEVFLEAKGRWPSLFSNFRVTPIQSTQAIDNPLTGKLDLKSSLVIEIIAGMRSEEIDQALLQEYVDQIRLNLDDRVREVCKTGNFKPYLHAEILVLDYLLTTYGPKPAFFNGWKYIGVSKPPCRLCWLFFQNESLNTKIRPSHGNLYLNWRFPEVHLGTFRKASPRRSRTLLKMMSSLEQDIFWVAEEKCPLGKQHDSVTYEVFSHGELPVDRLSDGGQSGLE